MINGKAKREKKDESLDEDVREREGEERNVKRIYEMREVEGFDQFLSRENRKMKSWMKILSERGRRKECVTNIQKERN